MKKYIVSFFTCLICIFFVPPVYAEYVLPYPSYMPGNKLYTISKMVDKIKKYWYWGTIAQIRYRLGLSDKYLVEAKTLFEYKQYLLATDALSRSDSSLKAITSLVKQGIREGKDMSAQKIILIEALETHISTIENMKQWLPNTFQWTPEKKESIDLSIGAQLDSAIQIRNILLNELQGYRQQYTYIGYKTTPW